MPAQSSLLPSPLEDARPRNAHLVGVCGSGMKSLAELLSEMGWRVTGSDSVAHPRLVGHLAKYGVKVSHGHATENLPGDLDLIVHTPAVDQFNAEVAAAHSRDIPSLSYTQMLGQLMAQHEGVAIAGTHGKSTTTGLLGWILSQANLAPSFVVGAEFAGTNTGGQFGDGPQFIAEACEYRKGFLDLQPELMVLLGLEPDHFDCFENQAAAVEAFTEFAAGLPTDGLLFANADCPLVSRIAETLDAAVTWFSRSRFNGWRTEDACVVESGMLFRVMHGAHHHSDIELPLFGRHHIHNALAAIAVAAELGVRSEQIEAAVASFPGLRRRFERLGTFGGVSLIDDYAHHPTAITATIRAARNRYPGRRLVCVFEPHQYSRTEALFDEFSQSLSAADDVHIAPIFTAREQLEPGISGQLADKLAEAVQNRETSACAHATLDRVLATLDDSVSPGDVLLTMGAGHVDRIAHEFIGRFRQHSEAG